MRSRFVHTGLWIPQRSDIASSINIRNIGAQVVVDENTLLVLEWNITALGQCRYWHCACADQHQLTGKRLLVARDDPGHGAGPAYNTHNFSFSIYPGARAPNMLQHHLGCSTVKHSRKKGRVADQPM